MDNTTPAVALRGITKTFGTVVANDHVNLDIRKGEILALLGENGSGKTTLMNMLSGIYYPDDGQIFINGEEVSIQSPKDAFRYGIGMIHQHFKLVDVFTATENIILGLEEKVRVWSAINKPYQISLFYKAAPVFVSSEVVINTPRVVDAQFGLHMAGENPEEKGGEGFK